MSVDQGFIGEVYVEIDLATAQAIDLATTVRRNVLYRITRGANDPVFLRGITTGHFSTTGRIHFDPGTIDEIHDISYDLVNDEIHEQYDPIRGNRVSATPEYLASNSNPIDTFLWGNDKIQGTIVRDSSLSITAIGAAMKIINCTFINEATVSFITCNGTYTNLFVNGAGVTLITHTVGVFENVVVDKGSFILGTIITTSLSNSTIDNNSQLFLSSADACFVDGLKISQVSVLTVTGNILGSRIENLTVAENSLGTVSTSGISGRLQRMIVLGDSRIGITGNNALIASMNIYNGSFLNISTSNVSTIESIQLNNSSTYFLDANTAIKSGTNISGASCTVEPDGLTQNINSKFISHNESGVIRTKTYPGSGSLIALDVFDDCVGTMVIEGASTDSLEPTEIDHFTNMGFIPLGREIWITADNAGDPEYIKFLRSDPFEAPLVGFFYMPADFLSTGYNTSIDPDRVQFEKTSFGSLSQKAAVRYS